MINLIDVPQRVDIQIEYTTENDVLTITVGEIQEIVDFTGLTEGETKLITMEMLTQNPILSANKIGNIVNVSVAKPYSEEEKSLYEGV